MVEILRKLLENVSDSYIDFVHGCLALAKKYNAYDYIIKYIENNPDATTSDITEYLSDTYIFKNK